MARAEIEEVISAGTTFFGVLLAIMFAIGVSSNGALKGPEAFVLRWTVITLAVAFSGLLGWLRWRTLVCRRLSSRSGEQTKTAAAFAPALSRSQPSGPTARAASADVLAAAKQASCSASAYRRSTRFQR